jgi:hypothetical protein
MLETLKNFIVTKIMFTSVIGVKAQARLDDSVRTSKRTPHFTITKINCVTLFK